MKRILSHATFLLLLWHGSSALAYTNTLTEDQPLSFGKFAMANNDAQYSIILAADGTPTYPPRIWPFEPGQQAIFQLSDWPPDTAVIPSAPDTTLDPVAGGPSFDVVNFTFDPANPVTDGAGNLTLMVGATLRTNGSGVLYWDTDFTGTYNLSVNY